MKQLFLGMVASCLVLASNAQIKVSDKAVISLPTLQNCDQCKDQIEFFIPKQVDGITKISVDLKRKTVAVSWLTDRTNKEFIISLPDKPWKSFKFIFPASGIRLTMPPNTSPAPVNAAKTPNWPQ